VKKLTLDSETREKLYALTRIRTAQAQEVQRAKILLLRADGNKEDFIADKLDITRKTVYSTIRKYNDHGLECALRDEDRSGRPSSYTDEIRAVIIIAIPCLTYCLQVEKSERFNAFFGAATVYVKRNCYNTACQSPKELGLAQEIWTMASLTNYINSNTVDSQSKPVHVSKSAVGRVLHDADIQPHKIKYYCEKRDTNFEKKMNDILIVYKEIQLQLDNNGNILGADENTTTTLSYDEKPGIQASANTSEDLHPLPTGGCVMRDYEYKRLGTVSLLAAIDLLSGKAIPLVRDTHKSADFVDFLKKLNAAYPPEMTLRLILDNHSIHTSKETRRYLDSMPEGRFMFVFTPKHGSWLNLIESFFSKMTRQMLRGIRVSSKDELVERIYRYFDEINMSPVIFRWKYKLDEVTLT